MAIIPFNTFCLPISDTRRLPPCSLVQSQIGGAGNNGNQLGYKTKCRASLKADIYPERKPDILVQYRLQSRPDDLCRNFDAYFLEEDDTVTMSPDYNICPPYFPLEDYHLHTCCNGLFYLCAPYELVHVLWNPTTCEYKILPKPCAKRTRRSTYFYQACGMWSTHRLEDCKVVNVANACLEDEEFKWTHYIDLYSLKTNSWKRIPCNVPSCVYATRQACFSGIFYFTRSELIVAFNLSTETFSRLPLPKGWLSYRSHILEYKGLLSAFVFSDRENRMFGRIDDHATRKYQLWIMRYGLWRREAVLRIPGMHLPLLFSKDGKLLYFRSSANELRMVDCATGMLKDLLVTSSMSFPRMFPFVENFVLLNGISCF